MLNKKMIFISVLILGVITNLTYWHYKIKNYKINGIITELSYTEKRFPTVKINENNYTFASNPSGDNNGILKIGDSLVKESGSNWVSHYRDGEYIGMYEW